MKLKLACADFTFPLVSHEQSLGLIAALGIPAVDIGLFEKRGHLEPSRELRSPAASGRRLRRKLAAAGLQLADMFLIPGTSFAEGAPNAPSGAARRRSREQFQRLVEYTLAAGGRHISALPGIVWPGERPAESFARSAVELAWRAAFARDRRLVFSVEPHIGSLAETPAAAARLVAAAPGLTLTLDYGHFVAPGISDRAVDPLVRHASHFHARGGRKGRLQASMADNTIDFRRIWRMMEREGYRGYLTLEYVWSEWERCNEVDNLSETVRLRDCLRRVAGV